MADTISIPGTWRDKLSGRAGSVMVHHDAVGGGIRLTLRADGVTYIIQTISELQRIA